MLGLGKLPICNYWLLRDTYNTYLVQGARYSTHNAESELCECFNSGVRECSFALVEQEIGTVDC